MNSAQEALRKLGIDSPRNLTIASAGMSVLMASVSIGSVSCMDAVGLSFVSLVLGTVITGKQPDRGPKIGRVLNGIGMACILAAVATFATWPVSLLASVLFGVYAWKTRKSLKGDK